MQVCIKIRQCLNFYITNNFVFVFRLCEKQGRKGSGMADLITSQELMILAFSFVMAFVASIGRSTLTKKPPQIFSRFIDALVMGVFSIPVTGIAYFQHGVSMWECWTCSFVFGSLGFLSLRGFVSSLLPQVKEMILLWITKGK